MFITSFTWSLKKLVSQKESIYIALNVSSLISVNNLFSNKMDITLHVSKTNTVLSLHSNFFLMASLL